MCGIVGYIGEKDAVSIIMDGLHKLEYRGYDSAGVAVIQNGSLKWAKSKGKLKVLDARLDLVPLVGAPGIGHTRWATHGVPSEANSHPHLGCKGEIAVVHNGIIENFRELREQLTAEGHIFRSQTDTEVLAHLVEKHFSGDLAAAVRAALKEVTGAYALGVIHIEQPDVLVAARCDSPLILGLGDGEAYIASDVPAILAYTRNVVYLDNGQVATVQRDGCEITDLDGTPVDMPVVKVEWDAEAAEKSGYPHFMLKEIHEQPDVMRRTLAGRIVEGSNEVDLGDMGVTIDELVNAPKITIIACGTAWHAALTGKYLIESFTRIPVEVDISSEYRYRDPIVPEGMILMSVSQSGETADTLAGIREAKRRGAKVLSIVNVVGSSIARESDGVIYTHAGPEIGVASTKAYTSQITAFCLLTLMLGRAKGAISDDQAAEFIAGLNEIPEKIEQILADQTTIMECADMYCEAHTWLYLGRGYNFPNAFEGALKLKEISYIHAEGYGAGEMKHGPIALVDKMMPVVCIATRDAVHEKMVSNIQEIRARRGIIIAIANEGDTDITEHCDEIIYLPETKPYLMPLLVALPMQLLAYHVATRRGCDVDQPRNLAKSVTVE